MDDLEEKQPHNKHSKNTKILFEKSASEPSVKIMRFKKDNLNPPGDGLDRGHGARDAGQAITKPLHCQRINQWYRCLYARSTVSMISASWVSSACGKIPTFPDKDFGQHNAHKN